MFAPLSSLSNCTAGTRRPRLYRAANDLGWTIIGCSWIAVLITLVDGQPQYMYREMVSATCVGLVALLILDGVRLWFWDARIMRALWRLPFFALLVVTAPVAHYTGRLLTRRILGTGWPDMTGYPFGHGHLNMIVLTWLGICAMALIIGARERIEQIQRERREAKARAETIERQSLQVQLRLLQAQIEPHMLFNTLANLQGLIAIDPARANRMLDQLIQYLRATLSATRLDSTTLADEFAAIDAYLGLMAVRMGARLDYRCELPAALRAARLPPMLLQPLVENAIIHGLEPHVDGGTIAVRASAHAGLLEISVADTGPGLDDGAARATAGGIGLSTTRERLQAVYGGRASLVLEPAAPHGVLARLTLPLEPA